MTLSEAHHKLGHMAYSAVKYAITSGKITGIELNLDSKPEFCDACAKAKSAKQPFPKELKTCATNYGECVHWDIWGPAAMKSLNGHFYVAAQIYDATCETKPYFQAKKSEIANSYKQDEAHIETHTGNRIKFACSNQGGEFLSKDLIEHQDKKGTLHELTVHDSPPQNGSSECGMHTHTEQAHALLLGSGLSRYLWEEAMKHSVWLQNHSPTCALGGKTPYEKRHGKKPHLGGIQEFGAAVYVKDLEAGKLDARAWIGCFVGYDSKSKGFWIYWPTKQKISVERNVVFNKDDVLTKDKIVAIPGDVLAEGERDKVIQNPKNAHSPEEEEGKSSNQQTSEPDKLLKDLPSELGNSVPFLTEPTSNQDNPPNIAIDSDSPTPSCRKDRLPPDAYSECMRASHPSKQILLILRT